MGLVRIALPGTSLYVDKTLPEVQKALEDCLRATDLLRVESKDGRKFVNPFQVLYIERVDRPT